MRIETGTFELRDNDTMMRELTSAETDEVAGGATAFVSAQTSSGANSSIATSGGVFSLATTTTTASAALSATFTGTGSTNNVQIQVVAVG
jgi:hypothetical protein